MDNTEAIEKLGELILDGYSHTTEGAAKLILAAIQADPLAYVKPKPLEWHVSTSGMDFSANSALGRFEICMRGDVYDADFKANGKRIWDTVQHDCPTREAAQAAAYEDLCNRVKGLF